MFEPLDEAMGPRIDKDRLIVDGRIAIVAHAIFGGNLVIGDAALGEDRANRAGAVALMRALVGAAHDALGAGRNRQNECRERLRRKKS